MLKFGAGLYQSLRDHVQFERVGVIQYEMVRVLTKVLYWKSKQFATVVVRMQLHWGSLACNALFIRVHDCLMYFS